MVTADELMIGNLLYFKGTDMVAKVQLINAPKHFDCRDEYGSFVPNGEYEGIPITDTLLIKLGFEPDNDYKHPDAPMYFIDVRGKITCFIHNCSHGHILFLHEVQNAFKSLTGKHLTIAI